MDTKPHIEIIKKKVKRYSLRISLKDDKVICTVPLKATNKDILGFIGHHQSWIEKQKKKTKELQALTIPEPPGTILFQGELYTILSIHNAGFKGIINKEDKIIMSSLQIENPEQKMKWYKEQAKGIIHEKATDYAKQFHFTFGKITIKMHKSKWGSCSSKGNLNFNVKIMRAPEYVLDYLIIHELVHTKHFHHGSEFWQEVQHCYPDWQKAELYLKRAGRVL